MDFVVANSVEINTLDDDDEYVTAEFYGHVRGKIVGIRYYNGLVNNKEMVSLVRQPQNQYDRNAVRVDNIMGQQVGHIKREMAKALAEVVDQELASIEGLVPYGADNVYSIAVDIAFWGSPENKNQVTRIMRKHGYELKTETAGTKGKQNTSSQQRSYDSSVGRTYRLSASQRKSQLDGLFQNFKDVDQTVEEEACPAIRTVLYTHQKQAVAWMRKKEGSDALPPLWTEQKPTGKIAAKTNGQVIYRNTFTNHITVEKPKAVQGGILADDMGLGKTLITISLILGNSWNNKPIHNGKGTTIVADTEVKKDEIVTIDLVSDDVVIIEDDEVAKKENERPPEDVKVVIETVPATEKEEVTETATITETSDTNSRPRRKTKRPAKYQDEPDILDPEEEQPKKPKKMTGKKAQKKSKKMDDDYNPNQDLVVMETEEKMEVPALSQKTVVSPKTHLCFDREPVPDNQPRTTLIVCPLSLISNWVDQVEEHVHEGAEVKVLVFHGATKKHVTGKSLREQDIVITTYQTLVQELKRSANTLMFQTNWLRVVLDEGHFIRNAKAQQSIACRTLKAERKWVLSGTPIQNSIKDLISLLSFLGLNASSKDDWWDRTIVRPISYGDSKALESVRCLLGLICMRRTKSQKVNGKPIINMPNRDMFVQSIELNPKERDMYDKMNAASKRIMMTYMQDSSQPVQYTDMLVYIMRLRQICCHPSLAKEAVESLLAGNVLTEKAKELATKLLCMIEAGSLDDCCICLDSITTPVISRCSHVFCKTCIMGVISTTGQNYLDPRCPLCRSILKTEDLVEPPAESDDVDQNVDQRTQASSKIHSLMHELLKLDKEDPTVKSLVVSQFTEFLRIIETHLIDSNIPYVLYHGGMTRKARESAVWQLQHGHAKVMLMTLKAGGVGLNLTAASQVFMMEPSWNPAAEDQCFDRVYRLGQTRPVRIMKFICKNTVEERMVEMQNRKRAIARASLQRRTAAERKRQTMADMWGLMAM